MVKGPLRLSFLFLLPLLVRVWFHVLGVRETLDLKEFDTLTYFPLGKKMLTQMFSGDLSSFLLNAEHPPLAKLMLGAAVLMGGPYLGDATAARLFSTILSSLSALILYAIGTTIDRRVGLLAWLFYSLDPLSVQYAVVWLDTPMTLFLTASAYLVFSRWSNQKIGIRRGAILVSLMAAAILSKYSAIFFAAALLSAWTKSIKTLLVILLAATLMAAVANPQFWISGGLSAVLNINTEFSLFPTYSFPSVRLGSFTIPDPLFYHWYFVERFLLAYVGYGTLPFIIPFIMFALLTLRLVKVEKLPARKEIIWTGLTLTAIGLLPRLGIFEYYYLPAIPGLGLFAGLLLVAKQNTMEQGRGKLSCFSYLAISLFVSVAPLSLVFSFLRPNFWSSILTMILYLRLSPESIIGVFGLIMSVVVIIWAIGYTLIVARRVSGVRRRSTPESHLP